MERDTSHDLVSMEWRSIILPIELIPLTESIYHYLSTCQAFELNMNVFNDDQILALLYEEIITEGLEEKIPKIINLVSPNVENKEDYIRWAAQTFDPTKNSEYITWILKLLKKGVIRGEEDSQKMKERLEQFHELKRKPQFPKDKRDINRYKTYGDLAETLDEFGGIETKGEIKRKATEEGMELVDTLDGTSLYIVTNEEAASKHFRPTDWCVKDPRYFNNYGPPYYYFVDENNSPQTLLHLDSNQCMDVRDRPTDLDDDEKELMSSERMTEYVLQNDNSDDALSFYLQKVGDGHDGLISNEIVGKLDTMIDEANKGLKMFSISNVDYYDDNLSYYQPEAYGSISYDMTPFEDHIGDREFLKVLRDVLSDFYIYPEDFEYNDPISEDLKSIHINLRYEDSGYHDSGIGTKIKSFVGELEQIENKFDPEEFHEKMIEKMTEEGYLSSGWADFTNRVSIDELKFQNFMKEIHDKEFTTNEILMSEDRYDYAQEFTIKDADFILRKYTRQQHPYVLLTEFLRPFVDRGLVVKINRFARTLIFRYEPKHIKDKEGKHYIKGLKAVKDFDTHFDFYVEQIRKFMDKFVYPFLKHQEKHQDYGIPENIKIPLLQIKGRKESGDQMMLDLHEKKSLTFSQFVKKYKLIN